MAGARAIENVARVETGLDAFNRGDTDGVLAILEPDVEIFSSPALANPGSFRGHDGYRRWVTQWLDAWEGLQLDLERIEPVGQRHVIVEVRQIARGRGSGVPVEMRVTFMFELADRATRALHLYSSWEEAFAVAEGREHQAAE
jgi:ketosteroid isomerase-like protein